MIQSKKDLKMYINEDLKVFSFNKNRKLAFYAFLTKDISYYRIKFIKNLRKHEYILNVHPRRILSRIIYKRKKDRYARYFNWEVPANTCGAGLQLWHPNIVINDDARVGRNCILHGNNCIGRKSDGYPCIGDNFDLGFGSVVIGNIKIGNNVVVGANSLVNKSFTEDGITLVGSPAVILKK